MTLSSGIEMTLMAMLLAALIPLASLSAGGNAVSLLSQADNLFDKREFDAASRQYEVTLTEAKKEADVSTEIEALSQLARCRLTQNDFDGCKSWLAKADAVASDKYPAGWTRYLGVKGRLEWREGRNEEAVRLFRQMYEAAKKHSLPERYIDAARMIAIAGSVDEQIEWGAKGIADANASGHPEMLPSMYNNLGVTYADVGRYEDALEAYTKAREYHWQYSGEQGKLYAEYQMGWVLFKLGRYDEALKWLRPSLAWGERLENDDLQAQACSDMGEIAIAKGNADEGLALLKRSLEHAKKAEYQKFNPDIYKKLEARIQELNK